MSKVKGVTLYQVPESIEQQMLDFYAMVSLNIRSVAYGLASFDTARSNIELGSYIRDKELAAESVIMRKQVIESEHNRLLRDLPLINAAEVKHITDSCGCAVNSSNSKTFTERFGPAGGKWVHTFNAVLNCTFNGSKATKPEEFKSGNDYVNRYIAAMTASKVSGVPLVEVAMLAFDTNFYNWSGAYGGIKWLIIAEAWSDLMDARNESDIIHYIDTINALQHNTTTLFNKCAHYGGTGFLAKVLDIKFTAQTPLSFVGKCSPQVQPYLLAIRDGIAALTDDNRDANAARFHYDEATSEWVEREIKLTKKGSPEAVNCVKKLSLSASITLDYEGAERSFVVKEIVTAIDGSRQFMMKPKGWSKTKPIVDVNISWFPFDESELVTSFIKMGSTKATAVSSVSKASSKAEVFVNAVRNHIEKLAATGNYGDFEIGSIQGNDSLLRIRLKQGSNTNCRFYFKFSKFAMKTTVELFFGYSDNAVNDTSSLTSLMKPTLITCSKLKVADSILTYAHNVSVNDNPSGVPFGSPKIGYSAKVKSAEKKLSKKKKPFNKASSTLPSVELSDVDYDSLEQIVLKNKFNSGSIVVGQNSVNVTPKPVSKHIELLGLTHVDGLSFTNTPIHLIEATHFIKGDVVRTVILQKSPFESSFMIVTLKDVYSEDDGISDNIGITTELIITEDIAKAYYKSKCSKILKLGYIQKVLTKG